MTRRGIGRMRAVARDRADGDPVTVILKEVVVGVVDVERGFKGSE